MDLFDLDDLDPTDPFEVDDQAGKRHLFKRPHLGLEDVLEVWSSDPLFYPAKAPAHWRMVAEVSAKYWLFRCRRPRGPTNAVPSGATPRPAHCP